MDGYSLRWMRLKRNFWRLQTFLKKLVVFLLLVYAVRSFVLFDISIIGRNVWFVTDFVLTVQLFISLILALWVFPVGKERHEADWEHVLYSLTNLPLSVVIYALLSYFILPIVLIVFSIFPFGWVILDPVIGRVVFYSLVAVVTYWFETRPERMLLRGFKDEDDDMIIS